MATLKLKKLHCVRRNDVTGKDEPRIKVDGNTVWDGKVGKGESTHIGVNVSFRNSVEVIAEEVDNRNAKQIGSAATVRESGNPNFLTFSNSGTWYEVYIDVTP